MPKFAYVDIEQLRFDPRNPRFPSSVNGDSVDSVLEFMIEDAGLPELMRSIASQGFFPGEPLLVTESQDASQPAVNGPSREHRHDGVDAVSRVDGKTDALDDPIATYSVIEGNRRYAASYLLNTPEAAPSSKIAISTIAAISEDNVPHSLPCLIFETRDDILKHLGYRHVTGIKEWEPLAKARFLRQRYDNSTGDVADRLRQLSRSIGSRSDYVGRLLTALTMYELVEEAGFFGIEGLQEGSLEFSLITSFLSYTKIVSFLGMPSSTSLDVDDYDLGRLEFLIRFVYERDAENRTRLGESRNLKRLAIALSDPKGYEALLNGLSLAKAITVVRASSDAFRSALASVEESISSAIDELDLVAVVESQDFAAVDKALDDLASLDGAMQGKRAPEAP